MLKICHKVQINFKFAFLNDKIKILNILEIQQFCGLNPAITYSQTLQYIINKNEQHRKYIK